MNEKQWLGKHNELGLGIWNRKYKHDNEDFEQWVNRVSNNHQGVAHLIKERKLLFGGRVLSNRGIAGTGSLSNCYSYGYVGDSLDEILQANTDIAKTFQHQGGQGLSLSKIRPKGAKIKNNGFVSDGIIPFMKMFNETTSAISMGGSRKGALMMSIDVNHPEALDFIKIKSDTDEITKANLSLEIDDEFMKAVESYYEKGETVTLHKKFEYEGNVLEYDVTPIAIYKEICTKAWDYGEPGILFVDQLRHYNYMDKHSDYRIVTTNPCITGDMRILTHKGYKRISHLEGRKDITLKTPDNKLSVNCSVWCTGEKETIKLHLSNGRCVTCTKDHRFMTEFSEEIEAQNTMGKYLKTVVLDPTETEIIDVDYLQVVKIEYNGVKKVYDFNEPVSHWGVVEGVITHNCGEQPLMPHGSCNLGSLNLYAFVTEPFTDKATFDMVGFKKAVRVAVRALDEMLDENASRHALDIQAEKALAYRNVGLGVFGYADMLMALGVKYGTIKALKITKEIFKEMITTAFDISSDLAKEKGKFPKYEDTIFETDFIKNLRNESERFRNEVEPKMRKYGLRNCSLLSVAPTGLTK